MIQKLSCMSPAVSVALRIACFSWRYTRLSRLRAVQRRKKVAAQKKNLTRVVLRHVVEHWHVVALEGRAYTLVCPNLRAVCAGFCRWFAKIVCSLRTFRCLAILLHLCGRPLVNAKKKNVPTKPHRFSIFFLWAFGRRAYTQTKPCCILWPLAASGKDSGHNRSKPLKLRLLSHSSLLFPNGFLVCPPCFACCVCVGGFVFLRFPDGCPPPCPRSSLGCCVGPPALSPAPFRFCHLFCFRDASMRCCVCMFSVVSQLV